MQSGRDLPRHLPDCRMRVGERAIHAYAEITDDFNPLHVDAEFAARSPMKGIIAHGMLSLNLVWQSLREGLGTEHLEGVALDVRFRKPVRQDDTVAAGGTLAADGTSYDVWVRNQDGDEVIGGVARVGAPDPA